MARQKGLIKLEGTIGDITFYKTVDGDLARAKGGVSADRIANDPVFVRTRENGSEFGMAAMAGKQLRTAIRSMLLNGADNRVTARLTKVMTLIKNYDGTNVRGERNVADGISSPGAKELLIGFDFNERATLGSVLYKPFAVDTATGQISMTGLVPINDIAFPAGATHMSLVCAFAKVGFATNDTEVYLSPELNLPIDGTSTNVTLNPTSVPIIPGTGIYILQIKFFQEVNGVQYSLKNGAYNALTIVDVA